MEINEIVTMLVVGGVAGWLAGLIMKGGGFGVIGNIVVGVLGAFAGSYLFNLLNISIASGIVGSLITAVIGSVVVLFVIGLIKK
jgi:uncharacterized membrane protein YeaQ/YmgE (transglycosylase-associated protein family)